MINYKIELELLTPVYIGNGTVISKKDYVLINNNIEVYDPIKLHSILGGLYEKFLMNTMSLTDFIANNNMIRHIDIKDALKYTVELGDRSIRKSDNINEFIKDPYGYPYIPGSSLKGAIRTAMLAWMIKNDTSAKFDMYRRERLRRNIRSIDLEKAAFGENIDSQFKHFRISDSNPIPKDRLILSKKIDILSDGQSNNKLNVAREALKPGTKVEFDLSIRQEGKDLFTIENILDAVNEFNEEYRNRFSSKFKSFNSAQYEGDILYLGGGVGFPSKTVNYALYGEQALKVNSELLQQMFRSHNHRKDVSLGVSPRAMKATKINNKVVEMGICKIRID